MRASASACVRACVRMRLPASACVCLRLRPSACVRVRASAHRKLNVRTRLDAKGSLRPDASFVQGLSGCTKCHKRQKGARCTGNTYIQTHDESMMKYGVSYATRDRKVQDVQEI